MAGSPPSLDDVVSCAAGACRSFARASAAFFNFEKRAAWLGWENWLSVEITRRLNSRFVLPFYAYPAACERLDLYVDVPVNLAVEIKTNYITDREARKRPRPLPGRVVADARKIERLGTEVGKLLLVSTCFESKFGLKAYPECVAQHVLSRFGRFQATWHDCSQGAGYNLLLALWQCSG